MSKSAAQLLSPLPLPRPANQLITSEEFIDWLQPGVHADLIGGEISIHSPVNLRHACLINFADHLLRSFIEHEDLGVLHREVVAVRLSLPPANVSDGTPVIVTFLSNGLIDLATRGINPAAAEELRARLASFADEWDSPEMNAYDDYHAAKAGISCECPLELTSLMHSDTLSAP